MSEPNYGNYKRPPLVSKNYMTEENNNIDQIDKKQYIISENTITNNNEEINENEKNNDLDKVNKNFELYDLDIDDNKQEKEEINNNSILEENVLKQIPLGIKKEEDQNLNKNQLVICEDEDILLKETSSNNQKNSNCDLESPDTLKQNLEQPNIDEKHNNRMENSDKNINTEIEIKDIITPVSKTTTEMFSITFESSPVILIDAQPKKKKSRIELINESLQINLVNDIFIPAFEQKIEELPKENFFIINSEKIEISPLEEEHSVIASENHAKQTNHGISKIEDNSYYETPYCSDPEDKHHIDVNRILPEASHRSKGPKNVDSLELKISDFNPKQINDNMGSLFLSPKKEMFIKDNEEFENNLISNPSIEETRYQKNIINSLDNICVAQYNINPNFPLDPLFFDILCINCYECVKYTEVDKHSQLCVIRPDEEFCDLFKKINQADEDVNAKIYKLYQNIKKKEDDIRKSKDHELNSIFDLLMELVYDIFLNNNSIEELDASISKLNILINSRLRDINSNQKFSLLIYAKRVSQLVYNKLKDIEQALIIARNNFDKEDINESDFSESDENEEEEEKKFQNLKMELVQLERQTMKSKIELEAWRKEAKNLEKMLRKPVNNAEALSDIVSDIISYKDNDEFDQMTNITGQTDNDQQDVGNMRDVNEVLAIKSEEDMKKYFFSIGLNIKFKYADKIKDSFSIDSLYEKAKKNGIPIHEWQKYIQRELNLI